MTMGFVHLQVHSGYSFMRSTLTIENLVKGAKAKGFHAIALTDEYVMHGAIQFYQTCKQYKIKPIIGLKLTIEDADASSRYPIIVLAENAKGYRNLIALSSRIQSLENRSLPLSEFPQFRDNLTAILPVQTSPLKSLLWKDEQEEARRFLGNIKEQAVAGPLLSWN